MTMMFRLTNCVGLYSDIFTALGLQRWKEKNVGLDAQKDLSQSPTVMLGRLKTTSPYHIYVCQL